MAYCMNKRKEKNIEAEVVNLHPAMRAFADSFSLKPKAKLYS